MEELLASIRKAIHDDIGEVPPAATTPRGNSAPQRSAMRDLHMRVGEEMASAASEIQHLREKINRSRGPDPLPPPRETLKPALQPQALTPEPPPRRSWRELEPAPPQPKLRSTILDNEPRTSRPAPRGEFGSRSEPQPETRYAEPLRPVETRPFEPRAFEAPPPSWAEEPPALPPPRDTVKQRVDPASMLSGDSAQAVQAAFSRLAESMLARASGDRTIEDITRELLRGMLKQWLDDHLPQLVERLVREEIERVARQGR